MKHTIILATALSFLSILPSQSEAQKKAKPEQVPMMTIQPAIFNGPEYMKPAFVPLDSTYFIVRDVDEIISSLGEPDFKRPAINKVFGPWVFLGYKNVDRKTFDTHLPVPVNGLKVLTNDSTDSIPSAGVIDETITDGTIVAGNDSIMTEKADTILTADGPFFSEEQIPDLSMLTGDPTPKWLRDALTSYRIQEDFMYNLMVTKPNTIDYSYWDLPVPPRLLDDDVTFAGYLRRLDLPEVDSEKAILPEENLRRIYWLHNVGAAMQFSQAYVSSNWYQGGNNHLAVHFNFNWNVQLNQVYYPDFLFQSALSYKLGLNSTPQDKVHAYSISEDALQYNLNLGLKAFKKRWYYSLNMQFKTQIFRNYQANSMKRKASFLSPGDLNLGLGMSYSTQNKKKTIQFTATLSPLSYNLKTCITDKIDHNQFNIAPHRHSRSEIGSNGEFNMTWRITPNINYRTRLFLFSNYDYFLADWDNTANFEINKFLSTQINVHLRYDTSTDISTKWKHFMMREVLSFGLAYTFSTKP